MPIVLQARFASREGKIWFAEKTQAGCYTQPEERKHESAFWGRNYNTILENGSPSDSLEKGFWGVVDNHLGELLPEVQGALEKGFIPILKGDARDALFNLFAALMNRSPDILPDMKPLDVGHQISSEASALKPNLTAEERKILYSRERQMQNGRHVIAAARAVRPNKVLSELSNFDIRFAITENRSAFILGSRMIYRIGNGQKDSLYSNRVELWFPISPRISFVLVRKGLDIPLKVEWPRRKVREFNEYFCRNSSKIGSHSENLLLSLTKRKKT